MTIIALKSTCVQWHIHLIHSFPEYFIKEWKVKLHDEDGIALECDNDILVIPEHNIAGILIAQAPRGSESEDASS